MELTPPGLLPYQLLKKTGRGLFHEQAEFQSKHKQAVHFDFKVDSAFTSMSIIYSTKVLKRHWVRWGNVGTSMGPHHGKTLTLDSVFCKVK